MTLKKTLAQCWKLTPGVNLYYYLQGEFNDNPQSIWPATKHVVYASLIIGSLAYAASSKLESVLNNKNIQASTRITQ